MSWGLEALAAVDLSDGRWTPALLKREIFLRQGKQFTPNDKKRCMKKLQSLQEAEEKARKKAEENAAKEAARAAKAQEKPPRLPWGANDDIALAHCMVHPSTAMAVATYNQGLTREELDAKHVPR
jgi:hypothetical protein